MAGLVRRLGGAELYGHDWTVGLREIISNACDAVKAREELATFRGGRRVAGRVSIWLQEDDSGVWLECADNGIGMTASVLGHQLLDFGCSSWLSSEVARANPGLIASRFEPNGKFGIGFFSVFMMGSRVRVASRPLSGGPADTWILEFGEGVQQRPTLRKASAAEQLDEPGTTVSVLLDESLISRISDEILLNVEMRRARYVSRGPASISEIIPYVLPAPECDIWLSPNISRFEPHLALGKNDWLSMGGYEFLCRVLAVSVEDSGRGSNDFDDRGREVARQLAPDLAILHDESGRPVGRLCIVDETCMEDLLGLEIAFVSAGPARTQTYIHLAAGILIGRPNRAARDQGLPVIGIAEIAEWANAEVARIQEKVAFRDHMGFWYGQVAEQIRQLGGNADPLPMWRTSAGWLNQEQLISWISSKAEVILAHPVYADVRVGMDEHPIKLSDNVIVYEWSSRRALSLEGWPGSSYHYSGSSGALCRAFSEAWGVTESQIRDVPKYKERSLEVGQYEGAAIRAKCSLYVRDDLQAAMQVNETDAVRDRG
ncbi:hypothetical protein [Streptomyces sp. NPDC054995]